MVSNWLKQNQMAEMFDFVDLLSSLCFINKNTNCVYPDMDEQCHRIWHCCIVNSFFYLILIFSGSSSSTLHFYLIMSYYFFRYSCLDFHHLWLFSLHPLYTLAVGFHCYLPISQIHLLILPVPTLVEIPLLFQLEIKFSFSNLQEMQQKTYRFWSETLIQIGSDLCSST